MTVNESRHEHLAGQRQTGGERIVLTRCLTGQNVNDLTALMDQIMIRQKCRRSGGWAASIEVVGAQDWPCCRVLFHAL